MDAISLRGNCRTVRPPRPAYCGKNIGKMALDPAIRITKLTTIASPGRLMKRSVNDFISLARHFERSEAQSRNPAMLPNGYAPGSLDFAWDDDALTLFRHSSFVLR